MTDILDALGLGWHGWRVGVEVQARALARGRAVHRAVEFLGAGYALPALHPEIAGPVAAYVKWADEVGHEAAWSERELVHSSGLFLGHPDRVGLVQGRVTLVDFKVSASPDLAAAALQLAGYALLVPPHEHLLERLVIVALGQDGTYRQHDVTATAAAVTHVFEAAVVVYHAQRRRPQ